MGFKDNFISFVPIIASFITSILGITTIVRAINRMFSSDNTIVKKVKLFFISLVGVLMFNVLFVAIILLVLSFTLFFTPFGSKLTTITIGTIILLAFLGLIAIIVKTIIERNFLLEIYFNLKYKDDNYKKTLEDIKLNVLAIEKAKITNQDMKLAERVLAIEKLKADKFSPKLNTVHSLLIDLSYLFYPALNTGLVLIAMNTKTKKELVIIIINVIAISIFNIIMMYRDIRLNSGMLTITEFILNGHFKRYQKLLKKQGKK